MVFRSRSRLARWWGAAGVGPLLILLALAGCGTSSAARPHSTPTPTIASSVSYVALGASDAVGVGADNPATQGYVPVLISRMSAGAHVLNLGISGIELHEALQQELPQALTRKPTLVTIWLVANDFKDCVDLTKYRADLETLLTQLQTQTHAALFMANLPDMSQLPAIQSGSIGIGPCLQGASSQQIRALVAQWNNVVSDEAQRHNVVLVDLSPFDISAHPDYISSADGFHPSSAGYLQLANLFWAQITAHKAVPSSS
jgi:lysophospholipase L1-like esterase